MSTEVMTTENSDTDKMETGTMEAKQTVRISKVADSLRAKGDQNSSSFRRRLEKFDKDHNGDLDESEVGDMIVGMIKGEHKKRTYRKAVLGLSSVVLLLLCSQFALTWTAMSLTQKLSEREGMLVSKQTGEALSTVAMGGGGKVIHFTFHKDYRRLLRVLHNSAFHEGDGDESVGTVPKSEVEDAAESVRRSSSKVRGETIDYTGKKMSIQVDTSAGTYMEAGRSSNGNHIFENLFISSPAFGVHQIRVECSDDSSECDVFASHDVVRRLAGHFTGGLYGG